MPSKPPISKAKKAVNRTAKKLPGKIAKRFKQKALKDQIEDERWSKIELKKVGAVGFENLNSSLSAVPVATVLIKGTKRKRGMTNRLIRAAEREKLVV